MSLKSFIIASIVIHVIAGVALYFYYNPIILDPKLVKPKEEKMNEEIVSENLEEEISKEKPDRVFIEAKEKKVRIDLDKKDDETIDEKKQRLSDENLIELKEQESLKNKLSRKARSDIQDFSLLKQKEGNPPLSYPDFARRLKMQGTISLLFFVDERGLVEKMQLESSSGHSALDNFVLRTLARYQFKENQKGWVRHEKTFVLEGEEEEYLRLRQQNNELSDEGLIESEEQEKGEELQKDLEEKPLQKEDEIEFIEYEDLEKPAQEVLEED